VSRALSQERCDVCHTQDYGAIWVRSVIYPQAFLFRESYPQISLPVKLVTRMVLCAALARNVVTTHRVASLFVRNDIMCIIGLGDRARLMLWNLDMEPLNDWWY